MPDFEHHAQQEQTDDLLAEAMIDRPADAEPQEGSEAPEGDSLQDEVRDEKADEEVEEPLPPMHEGFEMTLEADAFMARHEIHFDHETMRFWKDLNDDGSFDKSDKQAELQMDNSEDVDFVRIALADSSTIGVEFFDKEGVSLGRFTMNEDLDVLQ